jgi:hypothetical protein
MEDKGERELIVDGGIFCETKVWGIHGGMGKKKKF